MSEDNALDFRDLEPTKIPVHINEETLTLNEATGEAHRKFINARAERAIIQDGKTVGFKNWGDMESILVSLCLFRGKHPVPRDEIEAWPWRVQHKLYEKARQISGMDEEELPLKDSILKALSSPESPVTLGRLQEYASTLPDNGEYGPFRDLLKPTLEESSKN